MTTTESRDGAIRALTLSTIAFAVCFACWVLNAVLVSFLVIRGIFDFDQAQVGLLLAVPVLTGAVSRVPLGILADRFGGRRVMSVLLLVSALPMYALSEADSYAAFLAASLGFGLAGGSFAVGVSYVSAWFSSARQGTALGIFTAGLAGAALTQIFAPRLLSALTDNGGNLEGWRQLPRLYAGALVLTAIVFFLLTRESTSDVAAPGAGLRERLAPLRQPVVWRLSFYYFLVFGGFVALASWIIPYAVSVYGFSLAEAGLIAALFTLPAGLIRAVGGAVSDQVGARTVMYAVFGACVVLAAILSVPRLDVVTPGEGQLARAAGEVTEVRDDAIVLGETAYRLVPAPEESVAERDRGSRVAPAVERWDGPPLVEVGDRVSRGEQLAAGFTRLYYPANRWVFAALVLMLGIAFGIGGAGVLKFIPEQFPGSVGTVGGAVGLIGALGGFVLPLVFSYTLRLTGLYASSWWLLLVLAVACFAILQRTTSRLVKSEAPDLAELLESRPSHALGAAVSTDSPQALRRTGETVEDLLEEVPILSGLTPELRKQVAQLVHEVRLEPGATIFEEGDVSTALFIVVSGEVALHQTGADGAITPLTTIGPSGHFGELALLDTAPRTATAVAVGEVRLLTIQRSEFLGLLSQSPRVLANLLTYLVDLIRQRTTPTAGQAR